jgi:2-polyprenyl-3-methyl-5-hydroxy-6-metoxy-1,4-benzoquinol methylase
MVNDLAGQTHWDKRTGQVTARLPSRLNASVGDFIDLLSQHLTPGARVMEVGCAPGKFLLWCALAGKAHACGVEYAQNSYEKTLRLFADAAAPCDIRKEDFMQTTFEEASFDLVYSIGVVEHFTDPRPMVKKHLDMLKPGGVALIAVPNFGPGIYGWLQQRLDRENYDIHNTAIMTEAGMLALVPPGTKARVYYHGRLSPYILTLPPLMGHALNTVALIQPFKVKPLCGWLVLEISR